LFDIATSLTKLSMLSLIYRVVSVEKSRYRYVPLTLAAIVFTDSLIFLFVTMFQCRCVSSCLSVCLFFITASLSIIHTYKKKKKESLLLTIGPPNSPISDYWTISFTPQNCINEERHLLAAGCINTATDFLIVILPIPYVVRLKLPRKQQIIIVSLFTGGFLVTAAGAARTFVFHVTLTDPSRDMTWNAWLIIIVSSLELYMGIVSKIPFSLLPNYHQAV
jgi:hypothetical protein